MNQTRIICASFASVLSLSSLAFALDIQVGDVQDSRTTGQFFSGLTVDLKMVGDELNDASGVKVNIASALDDTGRDLLNPEEKKDTFEDLKQFGQTQNKVSLKLKNPARRANTIKELKGQLELYVPKNDPASKVTVNDLSKQGGKPIESQAFKDAGVQLTLMTSQQYEAEKKKQADAAAAEAKAKGMPPEMLNMMNSLSMGMGSDDANSLIMKVTDPNNRLVEVTVLGTDGQPIRSNGSMSSGDTKTLYFEQKIPDGAKVEIALATPKSLMVVPLNLQNIALP